MIKYYVIVYPTSVYIEDDLGFRRNASFIKSQTSQDLLNLVKEHFDKVLKEIREDGYTIIFYIPKGSCVSSVFERREEDVVLEDELSVEDLLYTERYSTYTPLIKKLMKQKDEIWEIAISGFHLKDCVLRCYEKLNLIFNNVTIKVDDKISDISLSCLIRRHLYEAYKRFQGNFYKNLQTL